LAIPAVSNLKSFPFKNTKCKKFEQRKTPLRLSLSEMLENGFPQGDGDE